MSACSCSTSTASSSYKWPHQKENQMKTPSKSSINQQSKSEHASSSTPEAASAARDLLQTTSSVLSISSRKLDTVSISRSNSNLSNHLSPISNSGSSSNSSSTNDENKPSNNMSIINEQSKIIMDCKLMRQRALERARLKSDEELGVKIPNHIKRLIMPISSLSIEKSTTSEHIRNIELLPGKSSEHSTKMNMKFESKTETDSEKEDGAIAIPAPLAKSETFDNMDDAKKHNNHHHISYSISPASSSSLSASSPVSKKQSLKVKISKFLSPSSSLSPSSRSTKSPSPTALSLAKKISNTGILKSIFNAKSARNKENDSKYNNTNGNNMDDLAADLNQRMYLETSGDSLNTSGSCSSLSNLNETQGYQGSFNALNVTNSPRLSRNTRTAKLNQKKQENEEKRVEKQRLEKRLRMSQEIQRKLDEIETKSAELEHAGVELERHICSIDSNDSSKSETKQKLEQELYNIIHQRNLLTRFENELNIQYVKYLI